MLIDFTKKFYELQGEKKHCEKELVSLNTEKEHFKSRLISIENIEALIQTTAQETQETLQLYIQDLVQSALDSCFPNRYKFKVSFVVLRGKTETDIKLVDGDKEIDPMSSTGGGVIDIISFALRLVALGLSKNAPILLEDEPFKFVSRDLRLFTATMLSELSNKIGIQNILVTHMREFSDVANTAYEITQKNKKSQVKKI